jgi:vitamin B12 transporter
LVTRLNAGYSVTRSQSAMNGSFSGKYQLPYIPVQQAFATLKMSFLKLYSEWSSNLTGRRYITSDNTDYLPGYLLNNLSVGTKLSKKVYSFEICFRIENIFDKSYQAIAHYPMQGRAYFLTISLNLIK